MNSPHFSDAELACPHCGVNACTKELVDALEDLRCTIGVSIHINDAYRCPEHNASIPNAAKNSQHQLGKAADIRIQGLNPKQMYKAACKIEAFRVGGIGVAQKQGYIHVDVRGYRARWCYDAKGNQIGWDKDLDL